MDGAPDTRDDLDIEIVPVRPLRPWLIALTVILVLVGGLALLGRLLDRQETVVSTFAQPIDTVVVGTPNGNILITASAAAEVEVERTAAFSIRSPRPGAEVADGTLTLEAGCPGLWLPLLGGCRVDYRITVPVGVAVTADAPNGDIELEGIAGPVMVGTSNGDVVGRRLLARLVEATTSNGSITLSFTQAPDRVRADTSNGPITIEVPDVPFRVETDTDNGRLTLDVIADPDAPRVIEANSSNGDITIRRG